MEAQNTAGVQDMYAAFSRGDIDTLIGHVSDNVTWVAVYGTCPRVPMSGERRGKAAVREFFKQVAENVFFSSFEPKDFIATDDTVVTLGHYAAKTPIGKEFKSDFAMVFSLRD